MEVPKDRCGICGDRGVKLLFNLQTLKTKYSGTCVYELLERFVKSELLELAMGMGETAACNDCYGKVNDYDAAYTKALIIQNELLDVMKQSPLGFIVDLETMIFGKNKGETDNDSELRLQEEDDQSQEADEQIQEADEQSQETAETYYEPDTIPDVEPGKSILPKEVYWKCNTCGKRFKDLCEVKTHKHTDDKTDSDDEEWDVADLSIESLQPLPQVSVDETEDVSQHSGDMDFDELAGSVASDDFIVEELDADEEESVAESRVNAKQAEECYYCDEYVSLNETIKEHMEKVHSSQKGQHKCKTCGFTAKTRAALCNHFARHSRPNVSCHICKREFQLAGTLQRHLAIHSRETSYHCKLCGKSYVHYSSYYMHQLAHRNVRLQKCTICGFELRSTSHLKRHMRMKERQPQRNDELKQKSPQGNMFVQSMFDMTLITVNFCQICYILKVGPGLGWLYYLLLGLFGMSLVLLFLHGFMGLFGRLRCSKPLPSGCFNCLYNASMFMVVMVYLVNLVGNVLMLKEAENKCQLMLANAKHSLIPLGFETTTAILVDLDTTTEVASLPGSPGTGTTARRPVAY
uniref:C2H2-type domain-containing protein n=1 Tax=Anopheles atroparvus TaxID=41427 RepID=A0A182JA96_ANOAO